MKNYDKLKSPTLAKTIRRFQKNKIFILLAVFVTAFLFPIKLNATIAYTYTPTTNSLSDCLTGYCGIVFKTNNFCNLSNFKFWHDYSSGGCYLNFKVYENIYYDTPAICEVNNVYRPAVDSYFDINFTNCNLKNNRYYTIHITAGSSNTGTYCFSGYDTTGWVASSSWMKTHSIFWSLSINSQWKSSISYDETKPCEDISVCPDCTNNCICGGASGATTSTSTIISDTFLDDNDISTIKSVSGLVGNKNYTIYYFPFLLFIYIFIILIVCLSVIYIFKIIRKK